MEGKDIPLVHIGDTEAHEYIPREHIAQMAPQMLVPDVNVCVYLLTAESGVVFTIVMYCLLEMLYRMKHALLKLWSLSPTVVAKDVTYRFHLTTKRSAPSSRISPFGPLLTTIVCKYGNERGITQLLLS